MNSKNSIIRHAALFMIYLTVSLIFISANSLAILTYNVSGDQGLQNYASINDTNIEINTISDDNASFVTSSQNIPLNCMLNGSTYLCNYRISVNDLGTNNDGIYQFQIHQDLGFPTDRIGTLYVDSMTPQENYFTVTKTGDGLLFNYSFTDYLASASESGCNGSGIGEFYIVVDSTKINDTNFSKQVCDLSGTYFYNMSGINEPNTYYSYYITDRAGNFYSSIQNSTNGDFTPPTIDNSFAIMQSGTVINTFSNQNDVVADVVVTLEDPTNLTVSGDLSGLNTNPAIGGAYKDLTASCVNNGNSDTCTFNSIKIRPSADGNVSILITATNAYGNSITKEMSVQPNMQNSAGTVVYMGPDKSQCTQDLSECYTRPGRQIFYTQISGSNYNNSIIHVGFDASTTYGLCSYDENANDYTCISAYDVPNVSSINMFIGQSADSYGNPLTSSMTRSIIVDGVAPANISSIASDNSCPVAGDTLNLDVNVSEADSPQLSISVNSSGFSTQDTQSGQCTRGEGNNWECTLSLTSFVSSSLQTQNIPIVISDLAGNRLIINYPLEVCQANPNAVPNLIRNISVSSGTDIPIDRRTASFIAVTEYVPLTLSLTPGASVLDYGIDSCVISNTSIPTGEDYFINSNNPIFVLSLGEKGVDIPSGEFDLNCTLSLKMRSGSVSYTQPEKYNLTIPLTGYNNPLGTIDDANNAKIASIKAELRNLDSSIKTYDGVNNILGKLCDIVQIITNVNSALQALKSVVIYPVALILNNIPGVGVAFWSSIGGTLNSIDAFVQHYIWPSGIDLTAPIGYVMKFGCEIYTCKFYTFSGLYGMIMDTKGLISAINEQQAQDKAFTDNLAKSQNIDYQKQQLQNMKDQLKKLQDESNSLDINIGSITFGQNGDWASTTLNAPTVDNVNNGAGAGTGSGSVSSGGNTGAGTGNAIDSNNPPVSSTLQDNYAQHNAQFYSALESNDWIINPYRSKHYDSLCAPAILYNYQKQRQIDCKYLSCLETQAAAGNPTIVCDKDHAMNNCLYIDSAQWKFEDNAGLSAVMSGLVRSLIPFVIGMAVEGAYSWQCTAYNLKLAGNTLFDAPNAIVCGISGAVLRGREIWQLISPANWKGFTQSGIPGDPSSIHNYCQGVDYAN